MATHTETPSRRRTPLSKERVLRVAMELADESGIESVSMRKLGQRLGVEAMSLYNHVANKEALLDGLIDTVLGEIEEAAGGFTVTVEGGDWKAAMRTRILTARSVMLRHPWAPDVLETRTTMSTLIVRYFDSVLGIMRKGGFSYDLGHHAMHALGSRALGFSQELFKPDDDQGDDEATAMLEQMADKIPYLVGMMMEVGHDDPDSNLGWCDDQSEFEFALDLILDGLERLRDNA